MRRVVIIAMLCGTAHADDDDDLARIPSDVPDNAPVATAAHVLDAKIYADEALMLGTSRSIAVPFPSPPPDDQNRTSIDTSLRWKAGDKLSVVASDRLDVTEQQGQSLWSRRTLTNELREAYVSWEPLDHSYLEVGRINVKNGAALGFDPTDWFRARTLVGQASLDPSVLRVNRLGTLMVRAQTIWTGGSASVLYAPKLFEPSAIATTSIGIDPRLDATNASNRALAEASTSFGELSVQALAYLESNRSKLGAVVTQPIGQNVIAYAEWAGGFEQDLIARAIDYGRDTGALPAAAPLPISTPVSRAFANDVAAGASLTIATAVTVNVEYHFHQSGLSRGDWSRWFSMGQSDPMLAGELWYIRGYANDQLEPVTMQQLFIRADWPKAFVDHAEVTGFAFVDLYDGSVLSQLTASYYVSDAWTAALSVAGNLGRARSERGSFPQLGNAIAEIVRYF